MNKLLSFFFAVALAVPFALTPSAALADESTPAPTNAAVNNVDAVAELGKLQKQLDSIKQVVSTTTNDSRLSVLNANTQELSGRAQTLLTNLLKQQSQLEAQLGVLGPVPEAGAETETAEVTEKRADLATQKAAVDDWITQTKKIREQATNLSAQIMNLRRNSLRTQLALNSGTILRPGFWQPLFQPAEEDLYRISVLKEQFGAILVTAWRPQWRVGTIFLLALAVVIGTFGYRGLNRLVARLGLRYLPASHLRRSFFATATVAVTVFIFGAMAVLIAEAFTRVSDISSLVEEVTDGFVKLSIFCAIIVGLGKAFLSAERPSWRLTSIAEPVVQAMRPFPLIAAALVFIFGLIEIINNAIGTGLSTTIVNSGLSSLLIALTACRITLRGSYIRRMLLARGEKPEVRTTLAGVIHLAVFTTSVIIILCLLTGYIALAHFLTYELLWVGIVLSCLYLSMHLVVDIAETLFLPTSASGKRLKSSLNLDDRHLSQASSIFSAVGKVVLILLALTALLNGTFGTTTPIELINNATEMWGAKGLEKLNLVPARVINSVICLAAGIYILHSSKGWLEQDFLPKTTLGIGIRASLVSLFTNIGYVLIILLTLATLGIQWNNLAWIVSALSVGIGFGLQEIVKNFISGLILLTERPVKVGDLVSISGIEGDIRRINVRATEIQLSDRSTVIVPNSQFISQNVRNVTMGNAQGVVTIELKFPLDIDPEAIRDDLLAAYRQHDTILATPAPSVTFKQLVTDGIVMSITGYVRSPRVVNSTKSDLLFEILKRLRANKDKQAGS